MNVLRSLLSELAGLFVEDRLFALTIAVWLIVIVVTTPLWRGPSWAQGVALFFGLAAILIASITHGAR